MGKIKIDGKEINYQPLMDGMYLHKIQLRLAENKSFKRIFQNNITDSFLESLKDIVNPKKLFNQNTIISVHAESGSGKSTAMISLAKYLVPDRFSIDNITFYDNEILNLAKKIPPNSFIIRDEGVNKAIFGTGVNREGGQLNLLVESCRKVGLSLIFIEPQFKEMGMVKWYLKIIDMDINNRLTRVGVMDCESKQFLGAIYIKILDYDDPLMIAYEKKKDQFIEDMKQGNLNKAKEDFKKTALKLYHNIDMEIFKTKKQRKMFVKSKFSNYTLGEVDIIATFLEILISSGEYALDDEDEEM